MVSLMRKSVLIIGAVLVILLVFAAIGLSNHEKSQTNTNSTEIQTISQNGVVIKFPSDWIVAKAMSSDSIIAITDLKSIDKGSNMGSVSVNVERRSLEEDTIDSLFNKTYSTLLSNETNEVMSLGNSTAFPEENALEADYISDLDSEPKQHKAIWVQRNDQVYVILCTAPANDYINQEKYFNFILSNIRLN